MVVKSMWSDDFSADAPGRLLPLRFTEPMEDRLADPRVTQTTAFVPDPLPPAIDWPAVT